MVSKKYLLPQSTSYRLPFWVIVMILDNIKDHPMLGESLREVIVGCSKAISENFTVLRIATWHTNHSLLLSHDWNQQMSCVSKTAFLREICRHCSQTSQVSKPVYRCQNLNHTSAFIVCTRKSVTKSLKRLNTDPCRACSTTRPRNMHRVITTRTL